jgi:hypothetical protein
LQCDTYNGVLASFLAVGICLMHDHGGQWGMQHCKGWVRKLCVHQSCVYLFALIVYCIISNVIPKLTCYSSRPVQRTFYPSVGLQSFLLDLARFFNFLILYIVGLLWPGSAYLHTEWTHTDVHALSGIWTHDPSFRASEDHSCLRPCGHCDQPVQTTCSSVTLCP